MSEPVIQVDQNLIKNGEFSQVLEHWTKGPINPKNLDTSSAEYSDDEGFEISYLTASDEASVSQEFQVPKTLGPDARYVLSFLHETYNIAPGRLVIEVLRQGGETLELLLNPTHPQVADEDQARQDGGQPLTFRPDKTERELALVLQENDRIRVSIFSPKNPVDGISSRIHVARLRLRVHLPPLQLQEIKLDRELRPADRPLYLCYGATHSLAFVPTPGNPWLGTCASWTLADNPQGAILAVPDWGKDHPLESSWQVFCPILDDQERGPLSLTLQNQYSAQAYPIEVSLGNHRLDFRGVLEAAYDPVLEYEEDVRLGVQVISFYTSQAMPGREVTWCIDGQPSDTVSTTDDDGWAYLTYEPKTCGVHVIEASVESLYFTSGVSPKTLKVNALQTDPWHDVKVVVDGKETPWAEKTGYPNRGSTYFVRLKLPDDSPLSGTTLALKWEGTAAQELGVTVFPELEEPVPVGDQAPEWSMTCDDRLDGRFDLSLVCSRLLRPSPLKRMSLARNLVTKGEVRGPNKVPVIDEQESLLLRVQVLHHTERGSGDPVTNALVDWELPDGPVRTFTGAGGWASMLHAPTQPGNYTIPVKIRAHAEMEPIGHEFPVTALDTSPWKNQVGFYLDDSLVDLAAVGVVCRRGGSHRFRVTPTEGSTVVHESMTLSFRGPDQDLGLLIGDPQVDEGSWVWQISSESGESRSGLFEWLLESDAIASPRELSGRLLSDNLADEVSIVLDQVRAPIGRDKLYPCLGAIHHFNVLPNKLSPLVGLTAQLIWTGTPAEALDATVEPSLDQPPTFSDGGARWLLDFTESQENGEFSLGLELPQLGLTATANDMALGHNKLRIEALHEPTVDPIVGDDSTWMWLQVVSTFTREPVAQVPVRWTAQESPLTVQTDTDGWSGFVFTPQSASEHDIEAMVLSPYDGREEKRSMTVKAIETDPWKGLMVSFDGQPAEPWGEKTYFPRRKGQHQFDLKVAPDDDDSLLFERYLALGMMGTGPAGLSMTFSPVSLGESRLFSDLGLEFTFNVGDLRDGSFSLCLSASKLARLSPANAMSVGPGSQVVSFLANNRADQRLDWGQALEAQVTVVSSISGRPMAGIQVIWRSPELGEVTSVTDFYGVARVSFKPTVPGVTPLTATAGDAIHSESIALPFTLNEPREIKSLVCTEPVGYPGDTVSATATVVSARTGEPLSAVEVMWEYAGVKLTPTMTGPDGVASVSFTLSNVGENLLVATVKGGRGGWDMASVVIEVLSVHARIKEVTASPNPAYIRDYISMTAVIVSTASAEPLPDREVFVSVNGAPYLPAKTDARGEIKRYWSPLDVEPVSLYVEVRNPGEAPQRWGVDVIIKG